MTPDPDPDPDEQAQDSEPDDDYEQLSPTMDRIEESDIDPPQRPSE